MKILVRGTNWIGDAVMSIPALRELRRIFPDDHITLHTRTWADGLFRDAAFVDEIVTFDAARWRIKDVIDNSQFLKDDGYDFAILLPNSFESAITSYLSRIPRRFGYNKDVRGLLLTDPIAVPEWKNRRHEVFYYLNLISEVERRVLGRDTVANAIPDITVEVSDERRSAALDLLKTAGVDPEKRTVAIGAGSTNSRAKRWPVDRFASLIDMLVSELDVNVVLIGSKAEADVTAAVTSACRQKPIDLAGKTDLGEVTAILKVADLLISNDMGLAHIAPAVGTQTIAIFGPTDPVTTRPYSEHAEIIRKDVECSPCMLRDCPIDHRCMTGISAKEVFKAAEQKLRYRMTETKPAIFIDRDGTLIEEVNFLSRLEDLRIFDFTPEAIGRLKEAGYLVIVVTNQSGIGRGIYDEAAMTAIHDRIQTTLGGLIDAFYHCPHLPNEGCECRKPGLGMITTACEDFAIDLERSWMIGDKKIDVETGRNAGIRNALVLTGYGKAHNGELSHVPDLVAEDLKAAVDQILAG